MRAIGTILSEGRLLRLVGGAALGFVLALGYSTPANAQYGDYRYNQDSRRLSQSDMRRVAGINGYSDGFERGVGAMDATGRELADAHVVVDGEVQVDDEDHL